ncbi:MAG: type 1 glutamine amidotransferase [Acidothermales bacterium]|nr:type 1 glutamine amidotransferase [Acidothermales bacterium]
MPVFGICFGAQLLARVLGGRVYASPSGPEIGWLRVETTDAALLEAGPWMVWHLDVFEPPPGAAVLATTPAACQAYAYGPHIGVQFHPEATVDSITSWAHGYERSLRDASVDAGRLLAESRAGRDAARRRAHTLTDRVVARAARALNR